MKKHIALLLASLMALSLLAFGVALAESENAVDLYYTPGEDLLLVERDGVTVWLKGRQSTEFGTYNEEWEFFHWYTLLVKNDTDTDFYILSNVWVDGVGADSSVYYGFDAHSSNEMEYHIPSWGIGEDEQAAWSALNNAETLTLELSFIPDSEDNDAALFEAQRVNIHFASPEEAESDDSPDQASAAEAETPLAAYAGVWKLSTIFDIKDVVHYEPERLLSDPASCDLLITSDHLNSIGLGISGSATLDGNVITVTQKDGRTVALTIGNEESDQHKNNIWYLLQDNLYAIYQFEEKPKFRIEDLLGTWMPEYYITLDENGDVADVKDTGDVTIGGWTVIEPDRIVFAVNDEKVFFLPDVRMYESRGQYYLIAYREDDPEPLILSVSDGFKDSLGDTVILHEQGDGSQVVSLRTDEVVEIPEEGTTASDEIPEAETAASDAPDGESAIGPGEVHKDKETVKAAQQALNDAGYDCGTPDGVAGKKTKKAISDYQTDKGLTVTGTVTDETLAALGLA